jgi:N-acetylglucosaminyldiphosphoundecaprenol N-acetyl-beta-D-mannosaminyltransferase
MPIAPLQSRRVLGVRLDATSYADLTARVIAWAHARESRYVVFSTVSAVMGARASIQAPVQPLFQTPSRHHNTTNSPQIATNTHTLNNPEICGPRPLESITSSTYFDVIENADLVTADGMPLVWMLRKLGIPSASRVYGPDATPLILQAAEREGLPVGFYGGTAPVLDRLLALVHHRYPQLQVNYAFAPPFRPLTPAEDLEVVEKITSSGIRILFVGLGSPKQDIWNQSHRGTLPCVMLGVGAAFDFLSGHKPQAPKWMQRNGLEWLFRLATEPRRLGKRYLRHNPHFAVRAIWQLLTKQGVNP